MKYFIVFILSALTVATAATARKDAIKHETLGAYQDRIKWFAEAQYGMFIHFGLYSHHGGEWKGEQADGYSEWTQALLNIPRSEYAKIAEIFNPDGFDADFIVRTAKAAGMKYLVITSKHHDGFCLWDSAYTEFDVANTPFAGRDILQELRQACRKHGLKFGIYYSIIDWHHSSQTNRNLDNPPKRTMDWAMQNWGNSVMLEGRKGDYVSYQENQVLELIKKFDPDLLWFDGDWVDWWTLRDGIQLYNAIRQADPDIIVNNRVAKRDEFELDFVTQEQEHFEAAFPKHWEACYTINKSWGYKKHDNEWKDAKTVYEKMKDINGKGGNLLLNVGPDGKGRIQPEAVAVLMETAEMLRAKPIEKPLPIIKELPGVVE